MSEQSYQEAVQALRARFGARWDGREDDGRDAMLATLREELGYSAEEARAALEAMLATGQIQYIRDAPTSQTDTPTPEVLPGPGTAVAGAGIASLDGRPVVPPALMMVGYWQIGKDDSGTAPGRRGQVKPSGL